MKTDEGSREADEPEKPGEPDKPEKPEKPDEFRRVMSASQMI